MPLDQKEKEAMDALQSELGQLKHKILALEESISKLPKGDVRDEMKALKVDYEGRIDTLSKALADKKKEEVKPVEPAPAPAPVVKKEKSFAQEIGLEA